MFKHTLSNAEVELGGSYVVRDGRFDVSEDAFRLENDTAAKAASVSFAGNALLKFVLH